MKVRFRLWNNGDWKCATTRQRGYRVIEELTRRGVDAAAWDQAEDADVVILQRSATAELLKYVKRHVSGQLGLDANDDIFGPHRRHMGFAPATLSEYDGVLTTSSWLQAKLRREHDNVHLWPEAIDKPYMTTRCSYREEVDELRVAWMGGTDNLGWFDLSPIKWAFADLAGAVDFCWVIAAPAQTARGRSNREIAEALLPGRVEFHPWRQMTVAAQMASCDVSIIALEQSEWCWSKADNKAASMMAMGLPTLTEEILCYREMMLHEDTGLTAYQADEWTANIRRIAEDADLRERLGVRGRLHARRLRSIKVVTDTLLEALDL